MLTFLEYMEADVNRRDFLGQAATVAGGLALNPSVSLTNTVKSGVKAVKSAKAAVPYIIMAKKAITDPRNPQVVRQTLSAVFNSLKNFSGVVFDAGRYYDDMNYDMDGVRGNPPDAEVGKVITAQQALDIFKSKGERWLENGVEYTLHKADLETLYVDFNRFNQLLGKYKIPDLMAYLRSWAENNKAFQQDQVSKQANDKKREFKDEKDRQDRMWFRPHYGASMHQPFEHWLAHRER